LLGKAYLKLASVSLSFKTKLYAYQVSIWALVEACPAVNAHFANGFSFSWILSLTLSNYLC
jgi:hypothetical protein